MIYLRWRALLFYFTRSQNDESKSCHQIKSLSLRERDFLNFSSKKLLGKKKYEIAKNGIFLNHQIFSVLLAHKKRMLITIILTLLSSIIYPSLITLVIIHSKKDDTQSILYRPEYIFFTDGKKRFVSLPNLFIEKEKRNQGLICCWFIGFTYSRSICRCHPSF